jgi:hypothetical protein
LGEADEAVARGEADAYDAGGHCEHGTDAEQRWQHLGRLRHPDHVLEVEQQECED